VIVRAPEGYGGAILWGYVVLPFPDVVSEPGIAASAASAGPPCFAKPRDAPTFSKQSDGAPLPQSSLRTRDQVVSAPYACTAESHTPARMLRAMRNYTSAWFSLGIVLAIAVMAIGWHAGLW